MATGSTTTSYSETQETATQLHGIPTPISLQQISLQDGARTLSTVEHSSVVETATVRSNSPAPSQASTVASRTQHDASSVATTTTTNTGHARATGPTGNLNSLQYPPQHGVGIPMTRPPMMPQPPPPGFVMHTARPPMVPQPPQPTIGTQFGAVNQPIRVDVRSAHQQYQNTTVQPEISPYSVSSTTSGTGTFSSPGSVHIPQQPRIGVPQNFPNQTHFHQNIRPTQQTTAQPQYRPQLPPHLSNPFHGQQIVNNLLGPDAFQDVALNFDYGAIEAYNIAINSPQYHANVPIPRGPATGGPRFNAAKAIFNQVDKNRDGRISREEFRNWAQGSASNLGHQSYTNYQTTTNLGNNFNYGQVFDGATPDVANILQQSGLGQVYGNFG